MKTRIVRDRKAGAASLSVRPQKGEALDYAQAEWLRGADDANLLEFTYTLEGRDAELFFDLTGTEVLPRYLKNAKLTSVQFQNMICAVRNMLSLCTQRGIATSFVRFDAELVRVTEDGALRFVLIPMNGVAAVATNTPNALLRYLDERCTFVVKDDLKHAEAVLDFVRRNAVLALSSLDAFLREQYGTTGLGESGGRSGSLGAAGASATVSAAAKTGGEA